MRTNQEIKAIADGIYAEVSTGLSNLVAVKADSIGATLKLKKDAKIAELVSITTDIEAIMKGARCDGVGLPPYLFKLVYEDDNLDVVTLSIRTKLKSSYKYRKDTNVTVDKNFVTNAGQAFVQALFDMYYIEQAVENVDALNEKVDELLEKAEVPYRFKFAVDTETDAMVLSINNEEVVFNASLTRAHDISSLGIFKSGDEYDNMVCAASTEKLVNALKAVQTPVQLIKGNVSLINDITGISTKKRASKLIRQSYHRQAQYLDGVKSGIGYFDETVDVKGEKVDVFALVAKSEDGDMSVVLNPFDVKTLFTVDFDVLKAVKKQMKA